VRRYLLAGMFLLLLLSGCGPLLIFGAGTAAGVSGYKYYAGSLTVTFEAPFEKTWYAGQRALPALEMTITATNQDRTSGTISAKRPDETPVKVKMKYITAQQTEVDIRVGTFGDEEASKAIKAKMLEML